jgi:hypothetical protein
MRSTGTRATGPVFPHDTRKAFARRSAHAMNSNDLISSFMTTRIESAMRTTSIGERCATAVVGLLYGKNICGKTSDAAAAWMKTSEYSSTGPIHLICVEVACAIRRRADAVAIRRDVGIVSRRRRAVPQPSESMPRGFGQPSRAPVHYYLHSDGDHRARGDGIANASRPCRFVLRCAATLLLWGEFFNETRFEAIMRGTDKVRHCRRAGRQRPARGCAARGEILRLMNDLRRCPRGAGFFGFGPVNIGPELL